MRRVLVNLLMFGVSLFVALLLAEGLIRLFVPQQLVVARPDLWVPESAGLGHRHAGNADALVNTGEREVRFRTDWKGYRTSGDAKPAAGSRRVLVLGDSFIEALSVRDEDTVTARLESMLAAKTGDRVELVNTAVSEYSPAHYRIVASREIPTGGYDAVVMFIYVINDVMLEARGKYPPRTFELEREIEWPEKLTMRAVMNGFVHPIYTRLRASSHLVVFIKARSTNLLVRLGLTSSGVFPLVLRRDFKYDPAWEITAAEVKRTNDLAQRHQVPFVAVLIPADYQVDEDLGRSYSEAHGIRPSAYDLDLPNERLRAKLLAHDVEVIDALPAMRRAHQSGVALYGTVDRHTGPEGHRLLAEQVEPWLSAQLRGDPDAER